MTLILFFFSQYFQPEMICFTLSGIFKESATNILEPEITLGFCRTFVLKRVATHIGIFNRTMQYQITNEEVIIRNVMRSELMPKTDTSSKTKDDSELTEIEQNIMIQLFQNLTNIKTDWCRKSLVKHQWVLQDAIQAFISLYEEDKIPKHGFNEIETI